MAQQEAIVAGGCFWCTEAVFNDIAGVNSVESGYIGGGQPNPTYREVCSGTTGHAEAIKLAPRLHRLGPRLDDEQRAEAENAITRAGEGRSEAIVTTIEGPAPWYVAEDYHQQYWADEGRSNPYCVATIPPKLQKLRTSFADKLKN